MHNIYISIYIPCTVAVIIQGFIQPILTIKCGYSKSNYMEKWVKRIIRAGYTFIQKETIQDYTRLSIPYMGARRSLISAADGMVSVG